MNVITPALDAQIEMLSLLENAVAAHANVVQVRIEGDGAVIETLATGTVVDAHRLSLSACAELLPAAFRLCDESDDYHYGSSRSARMTGLKAPLPKGLAMVFMHFFPARDGHRHLVARLTYDSDTCCGTCGG
ncbi:hypothetical protein CCC_01201 [Paramagnetospirillum magnetotacticum MS-1]|uniref:Uncharacterized protein n=1 Tax=Paramagnetospirillum magnetotacticum MS-1 TaxID=272627 RepID=A0A0C2YTX5_PARME|nr:hypothetical protein [Paramagnetospirillum magnetotacticum]KIL98140.1 hypothetical protein CCC_01201 [Paramagnetospirillum magnetotacticum MS-1]